MTGDRRSGQNIGNASKARHGVGEWGVRTADSIAAQRCPGFDWLLASMWLAHYAKYQNQQQHRRSRLNLVGRCVKIWKWWGEESSLRRADCIEALGCLQSGLAIGCKQSASSWSPDIRTDDHMKLWQREGLTAAAQGCLAKACKLQQWVSRWGVGVSSMTSSGDFSLEFPKMKTRRKIPKQIALPISSCRWHIALLQAIWRAICKSAIFRVDFCDKSQRSFIFQFFGKTSLLWHEESREENGEGAGFLWRCT